MSGLSDYDSSYGILIECHQEIAKLLRVIQSLRDLTTDAGCDRMLNIREQADEAIERYGSLGHE